MVVGVDRDMVQVCTDLREGGMDKEEKHEQTRENVGGGNRVEVYGEKVYQFVRVFNVAQNSFCLA